MSQTTGIPWVPGAATGIGSLPYDDPDEACRIVFGELPDLPHLPELPGRGVGADMIGRVVSLLVDLHADLQASGWRLVDRPGADERRAGERLLRDLQALELAAYGYAGPLKVQVAGPVTLAAALERMRGDRAIADPGARRDIAQSLAEGVAAHVADIRRRVPGADVIVQIDEPSLPAVLRGEIPTASGFGRLRPVAEPEAQSLLGLVLDAAGEWPVVHCCASQPPVLLLQRAGARAISFDVGLLSDADLDAYGEAVDRGLALWLGVVPSTDPVGRTPSESEAARRVEGLWRRLGYDLEWAVRRTVVTPACGLASASPAWARRAYQLVREVGRAVGVGE